MWTILLWLLFESVVYMSCVPYVRCGLVCVGNFALALLRICRTKSKLTLFYQICDGCSSHVSPHVMYGVDVENLRHDYNI